MKKFRERGFNSLLVISDAFDRLVLLSFQAGLIVLFAARIAWPHRLRREARVREIRIAVHTILLAFGVILFADLRGLVR